MARLEAKYEPKPLEWYENPPVVYGFNIPRVRAHLEWLMGTHIVHALDKGYHKILLQMMEDDYASRINQRNEQRKKEEIKREKRLVLEGKMALDEVPEEIAQNAVIRINAKIEAIQKEKLKLEKQHQPPAFYYDYSFVEAILKHRGPQPTEYGEINFNWREYFKMPLPDEEFQIKRDPLHSESLEDYVPTRTWESAVSKFLEKAHVYEMYRKVDKLLGYEVDSETEEEEKDDEGEGDEEGEGEEDGFEQDPTTTCSNLYKNKVKKSNFTNFLNS